jgi:hypothetical protein
LNAVLVVRPTDIVLAGVRPSGGRLSLTSLLLDRLGGAFDDAVIGTNATSGRD